MNASANNDPVEITILVKALNEEKHIEACLRSALAAAQGMNGLRCEVLLADSVSTDRTVEIATALGVRVVQFANARDRNCGAALQLGYQYALGSFIYVLDGDMELVPEFLQQAYAYLQSHHDVAGVGGRLVDTCIRTEADRMRNEFYSSFQGELVVASLGGGGLYRKEAIDRVGYLSNRWLPAFEEVELAVRLQSAGYRLVRLPSTAILHSGHVENSRQMLRRLWRSRRIDASGMFLRSAMGRPWFRPALRHCWFVFAAPTVYLASGMLALLGVLAQLSPPLILAMPLIVWMCVMGLLGWRKRSFSRAALSVIMWHMYALGVLRGALHPVPDPMRRIEARELGI